MTTTTTRPHSPAAQLRRIAEAMAAVGGLPDLTGAACRGHAKLFDPAELGEHPRAVTARHEAAQALCHRCPALSACRTWATALPRHAVAGVLAARIPTPLPTHDRNPAT